MSLDRKGHAAAQARPPGQHLGVSPGRRRRRHSNVVRFPPIAAATQQLDVLVRVASVARDGNDVIEFEVVWGTAFDTLATVTLPDPLADIAGDVSRVGGLPGGDQRLIGLANGRQPDVGAVLCVGWEAVESGGGSRTLDLDRMRVLLKPQDLAVDDLQGPL